MPVEKQRVLSPREARSVTLDEPIKLESLIILQGKHNAELDALLKIVFDNNID
jgi:hypothetical protein